MLRILMISSCNYTLCPYTSLFRSLNMLEIPLCLPAFHQNRAPHATPTYLANYIHFYFLCFVFSAFFTPIRAHQLCRSHPLNKATNQAAVTAQLFLHSSSIARIAEIGRAHV